MVARSQNGHVIALPGWEVFNLSFWKIVPHPISFNRYAVMLAVFLCESFAVRLTSLMLLDGSDSVVIHIGNVPLSVFSRTNHECSCQTWQQSQQPCGQCSRLSGKAFSADPTPPPVTLMFLGRPVPRQAGFG